jgi:thioredoxin 1
MHTTTLPVINDSTSAELLNAPGLTVAKFTAEWCGPCHMLAPIFEQVAAEKGAVARFVEVDADASPKLSVQLGVRGLPTILVLRDGQAVGRIIGAVPKSKIEAEIAKAAG